MFIILEGYSAVHSESKKNPRLMDLQEQQMLTVFYSGYPFPEWVNLKDYVAARSPNIMKG